MVTERQQTARELHKRGLTYTQIGAALGVSKAQAGSLVKGYRRGNGGKLKALLREVLRTGCFYEVCDCSMREDLRRRIEQAL